ncbi:MAG: hypothetical protein M8357_04465, partial [Desulfobulbaceae bacterium]|nr:hypothetical protein [Desulfobulbaceae bacterium]
MSRKNQKKRSDDFIRQAFIMCRNLQIHSIVVQTDTSEDFPLINSFRGREKIVWLTTQFQGQKIHPEP